MKPLFTIRELRALLSALEFERAASQVAPTFPASASTAEQKISAYLALVDRRAA